MYHLGDEMNAVLLYFAILLRITAALTDSSIAQVSPDCRSR